MGEKGERGEKGEKGEKGDPGEQGPQGEPGITPEEVTDAIDAKQNKLTGQAGQVVGFDMDGAAVAVPGWSNPNLLDNWHFADPINQRGQTEYTGAGYTIDRWCSFSSSLTVSVAEDGVELSAVNSDWGQLIPPGEFPPGEYTVSILTSEGKLGSKTKYLSGDNANTALSTLTGAFGDTGYYCNLRREWSGTRGTLCAVQRRSGTAKLVAIKLEPGSVQTLAHQDADGNWVLNDLPPNKALELAKCQRYFEKLHIQHISGFNNSFQYKCTKRGLPSVKFFSPLETADSIGYYTGSSWEDIPAGDIVPYPQATEEVLYLADVGSTSPAVYNFTVWISADL